MQLAYLMTLRITGKSNSSLQLISQGNIRHFERKSTSSYPITKYWHYIHKYWHHLQKKHLSKIKYEHSYLFPLAPKQFFKNMLKRFPLFGILLGVHNTTEQMILSESNTKRNVNHATKTLQRHLKN